MVQYLYAAYSIGGHDVPPEKQPEILEWQQTILGIAKEEMGHFLTVQNVLRLIGGGLNLDREDFPWDIPFFPFPFGLERLSRESLAKYIFAESPDEWPPDVTQAERKEIEGVVGSSPGQVPHRVGELYELMIEVLGNAEALADSVFRTETVPFQASWDEWGRSYNGQGRGATSQGPSPNVIVQRVSSRSNAVSVLKAIARQGEWPQQDPSAQEESHFRRFLKIFRAFPRLGKDSWSPTWAVVSNPQAPGVTSPNAGPVIRHSEASAWATLFNIRYRMLLAYLSHSFRLSSENLEAGDASPRGIIISRTFGEMYNLRSTAGILVQLPLVDDKKPERAGPPFQMPYTVKLPAEEADCWRVHLDLIEAASMLLKDLSKKASGSRGAYAIALLNSDLHARLEIKKLLGASRLSPVQPAPARSLAL
jgi:hypothetical protein